LLHFYYNNQSISFTSLLSESANLFTSEHRRVDTAEVMW